jgi:DNA-binding transcriptional ArsR family regulator
MESAASEESVFRALADGTRRAILEQLAQGEATVTDLLAQALMTQSAVSQHLRVLREAELVEERRAGRHRYYRLRPEPLLVVRDWLGHYETFWAERLETLGDVLRARYGAQDQV